MHCITTLSLTAIPSITFTLTGCHLTGPCTRHGLGDERLRAGETKRPIATVLCAIGCVATGAIEYNKERRAWRQQVAEVRGKLSCNSVTNGAELAMICVRTREPKRAARGRKGMLTRAALPASCATRHVETERHTASRLAGPPAVLLAAAAAAATATNALVVIIAFRAIVERSDLK